MAQKYAFDYANRIPLRCITCGGFIKKVKFLDILRQNAATFKELRDRRSQFGLNDCCFKHFNLGVE